jgi:hypothetical protein
MKIKRIIKWILWNASFGYIAYLGVIKDIEGAGRVLSFAIWFFALTYLIGAFIKEVQAKAREKGLSVPMWLSVWYDVALIALLIWHGWIFTAIGVLVMMFGIASIYHEPKKEESKP